MSHIQSTDIIDASNVQRNLRYLAPDADSWVPPKRGTDWNVAIVGGGQNGVALAYALRRAGINNTTVIEAASEGRNGVWLTTARMRTLRTPPTISGPELGNPDLSFAAWYERRNGAGAFAALKHIPRADWGRYLNWYRQIVGVPVRFQARLDDIEPADGRFRLHIEENGVSKIETARKIVLANGASGAGAPNIPSVIADHIARTSYSHTADEIDFERFRDKDIAVVGCGASAFDAAAAALEAGAREVRMFARRADLPARSAIRPRMFPGAIEGMRRLPDDVRWKLQQRVLSVGTSAPADSIARVVKYPHFHLHLSSRLSNAATRDDHVTLTAAGRAYVFSHVILGTGFSYDPDLSPQLRRISDKIKRWSDADIPTREDIGTRRSYPYITPDFQFSEKTSGSAPYLGSLYCFTPAASPSFARIIGDIPSISFAVPKIVASIAQSLFFEDLESHHLERLLTPGDTEFLPSLYAASLHDGPGSSAA